MRRLLVIGKKIPRLTCIEWDECGHYNLLDYQGLLIDCRDPARISQAPGLGNVLEQFMQYGHAVFVILPGADTSGLVISILPYLKLSIQPVKGETLRVASPTELVREYLKSLRGHEILVNVGATVHNIPYGWKWTTTVSDNINRIVCGQLASARIFHPPAAGNDAVAVKAILDFFQPDYAEPEPEPQPDWAMGVSAKLPGMVELEAALSTKKVEIAQLQSQMERDEARKLELARWSEMLWLDGVSLQNRVSEALIFLGIPNKSRDSTGHTQDLEGTLAGRVYLFEVTGSNGAIIIDKGRQLLQWLAEAADPTNSKGILIGNAFRKHAPSARPPSANHRIFVKELEEMANKFHLALVDVREIFGLVVRKLGGEDIAAERICQELDADGVIRFSGPELPTKPGASS